MKQGPEVFEELRKSFDGSESFMTRGHQIIKVRRGNRKTPTWVKDRKKVQQILLHSFPKMQTNALQRERAGRWARIIHLYFKVQMTYGQVAEELGMPPRRVEGIIRSIHRAASGRKANGKGQAGKRPTGRPKKQVP
jgi:hypothetical protein